MSATLPVLAELSVQQQKATVRRLINAAVIESDYFFSLSWFYPIERMPLSAQFRVVARGKVFACRAFPPLCPRATALSSSLPACDRQNVGCWCILAVCGLAGRRSGAAWKPPSRRRSARCSSATVLRLAAPARPIAAASPSPSQVGWSRAPDWTEDRKNAPRYTRSTTDLLFLVDGNLRSCLCGLRS